MARATTTPPPTYPSKPLPGLPSTPKPAEPMQINVNLSSINVYHHFVGLDALEGKLMALREDVQAGFDTLNASNTEVRSSIDTLAQAVTARDERDAQRIADLEAVIATLSANDEADASTIQRLQNIVDGYNAQQDEVISALNNVNANLTQSDAAIDALANAQAQTGETPDEV